MATSYTTHCPSCMGEDVGGWCSALYKCGDCGMPCASHLVCRCGSKNPVMWREPQPASCSDCGWTGDPYDLLEMEHRDE